MGDINGIVMIIMCYAITLRAKVINPHIHWRYMPQRRLTMRFG
jgi:hypothetical protein